MVINNNPNGSKGVKQIRYPEDDMILRFTSKDHIGEIVLENDTGLFKFFPGIAPEELEGYVTLETDQTITGEKTFDSTNIILEGSEIKFVDYLSNPPFNDEVVTATIGRVIKGTPGERSSLVTINGELAFTPSTLVAGNGMDIQLENTMVPKKYIISTTALQNVSLSTVYQESTITISTDTTGNVTEIQPATTTKAGVMTSTDRVKLEDAALKSSNQTIEGYYTFEKDVTIKSLMPSLNIRSTSSLIDSGVYIYSSGGGIIARFSAEDASGNTLIRLGGNANPDGFIEISNNSIDFVTDYDIKHPIWNKLNAPLVEVLTNSGTGSKVLADNGTYIDISGLGSGDMAKAVYDPTSINASAFDYNNFINTPTIPTTTDQIAEGTGNLYFKDSRVTTNVEVSSNTASRHSHSNKTLLDSLINTGGGTKFLNDAGNYVAVSSGSGDAVWGSISGVIGNQADLYTAFPSKDSVSTITGSKWTFSHDIQVEGNITNWFFDLWEWDDTAKILKCKHNLFASGEITAFAETNPPLVNWWDSMPLATSTKVGGIKAQVESSGYLNGIAIDSNGFLKVDPTYAGGGTTASWGSITGTLSDQDDLQDALNAKANTSHSHTISDVSTLSDALVNRPTKSEDANILGKWTFTGDLKVSNILVTGNLEASNTNVNLGNTVIYNLEVSSGADITGDLAVDGNITATGEITSSTSSDIRLKMDIEDIEDGLDIINRLKPITFKWNTEAVELNNNKNCTAKHVGLIAQEVEEVLPEVVGTIYKDYKSVDYALIVPHLIKAIQQLTVQVEELKTKCNG